MLTQLAPKARTPPSPNSRAWKPSATLTAMTAAHGPNRIATSAAPTACAVVPSGIGTLNIITRKHIADRIASNGTLRLRTILVTRLLAVTQNGRATA